MPNTLARAALLLLPLAMVPSAQESLRDALVGGRTRLDLRYRVESVDADGFSRDALASTLRTALGYETKSWHDLSLALEFEDVAQVGDDTYNSSVNGKGAYPAVLDPTGSAVNQAYLRYDGPADTEVRLGRQELLLDNERFVGNVGWRQNHQSFDGLTARWTGAPGWTLTYAYFDDVNRITGSVLNTETNLLNVGYDVEGVGRLTGYVYHLDVQTTPILSSSTVGLRFAGSAEVSGEVDLLYTAELATQTDSGSNPNDVDADYSFLELGARVAGVTARIGLETLGGSGDPGDAFQTPLATGHKFNGFADLFAAGTPDEGLEDLMLGLAGGIGPVDASATYHVFRADSGGLDYGKELDLVLGYALGTHTSVGLKLADFSADDAFADTTKVMVWLGYAVL